MNGRKKVFWGMGWDGMGLDGVMVSVTGTATLGLALMNNEWAIALVVMSVHRQMNNPLMVFLLGGLYVYSEYGIVLKASLWLK